MSIGYDDPTTTTIYIDDDDDDMGDILGDIDGGEYRRSGERP